MLSKRLLASSFYESICPRCAYRTTFAASNLIMREFLNVCQGKSDYEVISYDIKCQLCLNKFQPTRHKTANFFTNPGKLYTFTPMQLSYVGQMRSFVARVPTGTSSI